MKLYLKLQFPLLFQKTKIASKTFISLKRKKYHNETHLFVLGGILHWFDESRWESAMTSFFVYIFGCHRKTVGFHASSTSVESYLDSMKILRALAHCHWKTVGFHIIISIVESYLVSMTTIIKSWILVIFQKNIFGTGCVHELLLNGSVDLDETFRGCWPRGQLQN